MVAGTDFSNSVLQKEFPEISCIPLFGYEVKYAHSKSALPFVMMKQVPKILSKIYKENKWLRENISSMEIDIVISDNRYGLFTHKVKNIFITHQVNIAVPQSVFLEKIVNGINHFFLRKYHQVWIPDYEDNLQAGKLSLRNSIQNVSYIGNLSRFEKKDFTQKKYDVACILSGPEPQRTLLENIIRKQAQNTHLNIALVRGSMNPAKADNANLIVYDYLPQHELQNLISSSEIVICRSGYSTVMDLIKLNKNAVLIPTPGQTEQEYLAEYLSDKNWFITMSQEKFDLNKAVKKYYETAFAVYPFLDFEKYKKVIDQLLSE